MTTSDREQPESPLLNDLTCLCGMIAGLSGAGALGGAIGMARVKHLDGGQFLMAVLFGFLIGIVIAWAVWLALRRAFLTVLRRKAAKSELPWTPILAVMYGVLLVCFALSGYLGALLTGLLIRNYLG